MPIDSKVQRILNALSLAVRQNKASISLSPQDGAVLESDPSTPELLTKMLLKLPEDSQRQKAFRAVADIKWISSLPRPNDCMYRIVAALRTKLLSPLLELSVAFESQAYYESGAQWGNAIIQAAFAPETMADALLQAANWRIEAIERPSLFSLAWQSWPLPPTVEQVGALAHLLSAIQSKYAKEMENTWKLRQEVERYIDLLPLGQAGDALEVRTSASGLYTQLFNRAVDRPDEAPVAKPGNTEYSLSLPPVSRPEAARRDIKHTLQAWAQQVSRSVYPVDVSDFADALERVLTLYPEEVAKALCILIPVVGSMGRKGVDTEERIADMIAGLPDSVFMTLVPLLLRTAPSAPWLRSIVQKKIPAWFASYGVQSDFAKHPAFISEPGSVERLMRILPVSLLQDWIVPMRPSQARTAYLEAVFETHGPEIGLDDRTRLYLSQSRDGRIRQEAILAPDLPKKSTLKRSPSVQQS